MIEVIRPLDAGQLLERHFHGTYAHAPRRERNGEANLDVPRGVQLPDFG